MAVHAVSLKWLSQFRASTTQLGGPPSATSSSTEGKLSEENHDCNQAKADIPAVAKEAKIEKVDDPHAEIGRDLLGLCQTEIDGLLNQLGSAGGRALLALIYKLSSIESQLTSLRMLLAQCITANLSKEAATPAPHGPSASSESHLKVAGQPGILDQVFQSNLALWNSMN